jgi:hypothetical protein
VLSTSVGAKGIAGLTPGQELLIVDDPGQFAEQLVRLPDSPETLSDISKRGREFYLANHSSVVISDRLGCYLMRYFEPLPTAN